MIKPKAHYHPDTDTLVIVLSDHPGTEAEEVAEDVIVTYDDDNKVVAIEILDGAKELFTELIQSQKKREPARRK